MGGHDEPLEVGVISLGTTTADGQKREVRVEVLGVLDRKTKQFRLRATEPVPGANQADRFTKIFEVMNVWAHTSSRIITDFSVDKETLVRLGYKKVHQCSLSQAQNPLDVLKIYKNFFISFLIYNIVLVSLYVI